MFVNRDSVLIYSCALPNRMFLFAINYKRKVVLVQVYLIWHRGTWKSLIDSKLRCFHAGKNMRTLWKSQPCNFFLAQSALGDTGTSVDVELVLLEDCTLNNSHLLGWRLNMWRERDYYYPWRISSLASCVRTHHRLEAYHSRFIVKYYHL